MLNDELVGFEDFLEEEVYARRILEYYIINFEY